MSVKLDTKIKSTEAAIASETDPKKLRSLRATLAILAGARAELDDDGDEDEDDEDDEDEDGDESKAAKAAKAAKMAKKTAEAAKHRSKAAEHKQKAAEYEEAAKKCEEDEEDEDEDEEEAEARLRTYAPSDFAPAGTSASLTPGASAAITAQAERIAKLERDAVQRDRASKDRERTAMIDEALAQRRITKPESVTLRKKDHAFVTDYLAMRPKALVATEEENLTAPLDDGNPRRAELPADVMASIDDTVKASGLTGDKAAALRSEAIKNAHKTIATLNGAARY